MIFIFWQKVTLVKLNAYYIKMVEFYHFKVILNIYKNTQEVFLIEYTDSMMLTTIIKVKKDKINMR